MKGISIIIWLTLLATVTAWNQEHKSKSGFKSQDAPTAIKQPRVIMLNSPKSNFLENKEHIGSRERRNAMTVLEIRDPTEETDVKVKTTVKPTTRPAIKIGHYFINLGKHKRMSLESKRVQQQMAEIYEGSGTTDPTPEGSGETETSDPFTVSFTTQSTISTPSKCQNGGTYNGFICICPSNFEGPECEFIKDLLVGKVVDTFVKVTLKIVNHPYTDALNDKTSAEYAAFESNFKTEMDKVYGNVPGYKGVQIGAVSQGSIVVEHNVTVETEYKNNSSVTEDYSEIFQVVNTVLEKLVADNCTGEGSYLCKKGIPVDYLSYFSPVVTDSGLTCVSECNVLSPRFKDCTRGTCHIQITAVYGSAGAVAAALLIIIITVAILLSREKRHKKKRTKEPFSNDMDYKWYEDDEQWNNTNQNIPVTNLALREDDYAPRNQYSTNKQSFKPSLENVETGVQMKILRPEVNKSL
uniref:SEA domain-containing protein n=1 Tax=Xenopus tropicalis TaxID=8364 RepID=A0A1B8Y6V1_XENTR